MLLVGGPADGRRVHIDGPRPYIDVAVATPPSISYDRGRATVDTEHKKVRYEAHWIAVGRQDLYVYAYAGMTDFEVWVRLIGRYPKEDE